MTSEHAVESQLMSGESERESLLAYIREMEAALREAYQISHYGRGSMQDIDDVLERAIRLCGGFTPPKAGNP